MSFIERIATFVPGREDFSLDQLVSELKLSEDKLLSELRLSEVRKNPFPHNVTEWNRSYCATLALGNYILFLGAEKDLAFRDKNNQSGNKPPLCERIKDLIGGSYSCSCYVYEKKKFSRKILGRNYSSILCFDGKTSKKIYSVLESTFKNTDREIKHKWLY